MYTLEQQELHADKMQHSSGRSYGIYFTTSDTKLCTDAGWVLPKLVAWAAYLLLNGTHHGNGSLCMIAAPSSRGDCLNVLLQHADVAYCCVLVNS